MEFVVFEWQKFSNVEMTKPNPLDGTFEILELVSIKDKFCKEKLELTQTFVVFVGQNQLIFCKTRQFSF